MTFYNKFIAIKMYKNNLPQLCEMIHTNTNIHTFILTKYFILFICRFMFYSLNKIWY